MSRHKFRGKIVHTEEWVYGGYFWNTESGCGVDHFIFTEHNQAVNVDPRSIGEFTGLKDQYGIEIYEGDKVKGTAVITDDNGYDTGFDTIGYVRYDTKYTCFTIVEHVKGPVENYINFLFQMDESTLKVYGNIHDEPIDYRTVF